MNAIIKRAIEKKPPFEGKTGKSDKGFKDTVIYYSILEYAWENKGEYYFLSNDKVFLDKENARLLRNEFNVLTNCRFELVSSVEEFENIIAVTKPLKHLESLGYTYKDYSNQISGDYNNVPFLIKQRFPVFSGDEEIVSRINEQTNRMCRSDREWCEGTDRRKFEYEPDMEYESNFEGKVCFNAKGIVSICFIDYKYIGGVHGGTTVSTYTYDLNEGRIITLSDLTGKRIGELQKMINTCLEEDMKNSPPYKYFRTEKIKDINVMNIPFYIDSKGIHIVFNEYEVGPYASGTIDLVLERWG